MSDADKITITKEITIEELIVIKPDAVRYLMDKGIRCLICGEPAWGTLESVAREKGFSDKDIEKFVEELNKL